MSKECMERWIEDTRMFQRIAGVPESSRWDMEQEWKEMRPGWRRRTAEHAREHRIIQDMAIKAGKARRS
jgi:hypothetical protein